MSLHQRRYPDWLLAAETRLTRRRDLVTRSVIVSAVIVGVAEAAVPWERVTPSVPWWAHIIAAAIALPLLWSLAQSDHRAKLAAFTAAMSDLSRRLLFLDNIWDTEHAALTEQYEASVLRPTQRALHDLQPGVVQRSLRLRVDWYYKALPTSVHEADRMGLLSLLHPLVLVSWVAALALCATLLPFGLVQWGANHGLTLLVLLGPIYLIQAHFNTRFAFELALYDWLRLG